MKQFVNIEAKFRDRSGHVMKGDVKAKTSTYVAILFIAAFMPIMLFFFKPRTPYIRYPRWSYKLLSSYRKSDGFKASQANQKVIAFALCSQID
jgi:hypothetical protein